MHPCVEREEKPFGPKTIVIIAIKLNILSHFAEKANNVKLQQGGRDSD
jgi:hypothetical protein